MLPLETQGLFDISPLYSRILRLGTQVFSILALFIQEFSLWKPEFIRYMPVLHKDWYKLGEARRSPG